MSQKAKAALQTPSTKPGSLQKAGNTRAPPPPLRKTQLHKGIKAGPPFASAVTKPHDEAVREVASAPLLPGQVVHIEADRCGACLCNIPQLASRTDCSRCLQQDATPPWEDSSRICCSHTR